MQRLLEPALFQQEQECAIQYARPRSSELNYHSFNSAANAGEGQGFDPEPVTAPRAKGFGLLWQLCRAEVFGRVACAGIRHVDTMTYQLIHRGFVRHFGSLIESQVGPALPRCPRLPAWMFPIGAWRVQPCSRQLQSMLTSCE